MDRNIRICITARSILAEIGHPHLKLAKIHGQGYWLFILDDGRDLFETRSVMVPRLCWMDRSQWVAEGRALIAEFSPPR